jgi:hypothetical protein
MDSTQANGQPLGSSQTDKGAEIHGVPEIFKKVKWALDIMTESTLSYLTTPSNPYYSSLMRMHLSLKYV